LGLRTEEELEQLEGLEVPVVTEAIETYREKILCNIKKRLLYSPSFVHVGIAPGFLPPFVHLPCFLQFFTVVRQNVQKVSASILSA
jgi:hypothetical protein